MTRPLLDVLDDMQRMVQVARHSLLTAGRLDHSRDAIMKIVRLGSEAHRMADKLHREKMK